MILIIILYALFAASVSSSKLLLGYTTPIFLTGIRMFIAGSVLLLYQYFYDRQQFQFERKHFFLYAQIIILGIYLSYIFRFWGLSEMSASKSMFLFNLSPFLSSLYSYFFFNERMTKRQWFGLIIGFIGLIPILLTSSPDEAALGEFFFISLQELAVIASVAMHSYSWIVMRQLVRDNSYSPMMVNGICMTIGGFLALITSLAVEGFAPVSDVVPFVKLLFFVIFISNIICHNLYGYLLQKYTATLISFAGFIGPLFAILYGRILFGEHTPGNFYLSTVIVFIGLFIFYKDELKQSAITL